MKRREFIKAGAATATVAGVAGVGGAVGSACGGLFEGDTLDVGRIPLPEMDDYLRHVDDGMRRIAEWDRREDIPETELDHALENDLGKKALRALYMAGMFGDLPDAGQVHPGMQERVKRSLPEMDEAVAEMAELLSNVSDEDAEALQRYLREKDNPGMEIAQWFDEVESALGVSARRRRQTRAFITQAVSRLKNQSPRLLFDEYVSRVERVAAQGGSTEEVERQLIARMGREAFFERQQRLAMYAAAWEEAGVAAEYVPEDDLPAVEIPDAEEVDVGVNADAGPEEGAAPVDDTAPPVVGETAPAPVVAAEPAASAKEPLFEWENRISSLSCDEVEAYRRVLASLQKHGGISEAEAIEQRNRLDVQWTRKGCGEKDVHGRPLARHGLTAAERKYKLVRAGWVSLGLGVLLAGGGVALMFTEEVGPFIIGANFATAGVILLLIGLFMLPIVYVRYRNV